MVKKLFLLLSLIGGVFLALLAGASSANAATGVIENAWVSMSNPVAQGSSSHTYRWYEPGTPVGSVTLQYCVAPSGTCNDTGIDASGVNSYTSVTFAGAADTANWSTAPSWNGGTFTLTLVRDSADVSTGLTAFALPSFTNPTLSNCNFTNNSETGTCYVRVSTYSGTDSTGAVSTGIVSLTVTQAVTVSARVDPTFTFRISGVNPASTATVNGTTLTSGITPSVTTLPFGNLTAGTPKYIAHSLTVTTNTVNGYDITTVMTANMAGAAYGGDIDGFVGNSATNAADESWLEPTGTAANTNTGWLGVGTDDTDVVNRSGGANNNEFFTLGTSAVTVAEHTTSASSEIDNVVFGIEVNAFQQSDNYTGTMRYQALPVY